MEDGNASSWLAGNKSIKGVDLQYAAEVIWKIPLFSHNFGFAPIDGLLEIDRLTIRIFKIQKNQMNLAKEFDELSDNYTSDIKRWVPYYREMIEAIGSNLPVGFNPRRILDLGCGNGNVTALLHKRFPKATFTLLDASSEMIKACQERFSGYSFSFRLGYFQDAQLEENTFDLVVAGLSLHHLTGEEKKQLFLKVFRCLSPGGCFSTSDLMIEKQDEPFHSTHLKSWESMAKENGTTSEEW